jgi:hypothetical protein
MMSSWIPWGTIFAFIPWGTQDRIQEAERQRKREELMQSLQKNSRIAIQWFLRAVQVSLGLSFLFAVATIIYGILYYLVIPSTLHEQEIFFDYGNHAALSKRGEGLVTLPTAILNLSLAEHQWESSPLIEAPPRKERALVPGVKYDVYIEMRVPQSARNIDIGMFMVTTTLNSTKGEFLAASSRPQIVKDAHPLIEWASALVFLFPYAFGLTEPSQSILVQAMNGFRESQTYPLASVTISLNHPEVQIYEANLTIIAQLTGVRYLMYHWTFSTAILVILNLVFMEAMGLLILYAFYNMPQEDSLPTSPSTRSSSVDEGDSFQHHKSGGIPSAHVERSIKQEPNVESSKLLDQVSKETLKEETNEAKAIRYRGPNTSSNSSTERQLDVTY